MVQGATVKTILIGALVFTLIIVGGLSMLSLFADEPTSNIDVTDSSYQNFNDSFNRLDEINESIKGIATNVETVESTNPIFNLFDNIFNKASSIMRGIRSSLGFMNDFFAGLMKPPFGVDAFVVVILGLILTVIVIFSFLRLVFQREP